MCFKVVIVWKYLYSYRVKDIYFKLFFKYMSGGMRKIEVIVKWRSFYFSFYMFFVDIIRFGGW